MTIMCSSHDSPNVEPIELQEVVSFPKPRPFSGSTRVHSADEDGSIAAESEAEPTSAAIHSHKPEKTAAMSLPFPEKRCSGTRPKLASFPDLMAWE